MSINRLKVVIFAGKIMKFLEKITIFCSILACASCAGGVAQPSEPLKLNLPERCDIIFSGDFMQHLPQVNAARRGDGFDYLTTLTEIAPYWKSADFAVVNLETTLIDLPPYTGYPMFRSPDAIVGALREAGVTHLALANNHSMDNGLQGVMHTIGAIKAAGLKYVGVWLAQDTVSGIEYMQKGRFKVALLNYTYGTNGMRVPHGVEVGLLDTIQILADISRVRADGASHVIAFLHWGDEYQRTANQAQIDFARWCRESGVDVVIGSHPHVVQQIDPRQQVVYSLGNFVSNQRERYKNTGISVRVSLFENQTRALISFRPHWVDTSYNIRFTENSSLDDSRQAVFGVRGR